MADISREEYTKDIQRIDVKDSEQDKRIGKTEQKLVALELICEQFSKVVDQYAKMGEELQGIANQITSMNGKIESAKEAANENAERIKFQQERGKVDLIKFLTDNWWKILMGVASLIVIAEQIYFIGVG